MIIAEEITKYYGLKPAVQDVSFRVETGEVVGLLGPNGAGKTTILRVLTCFMQPTAGKITVDGLNCRTDSLEVRKKIGFLPETVPLYTELSVKKFLAFSGTIKGLRGGQLNNDIDRVINECGLQEHKDRLIKHLSKGLKQRVGIAQALLKNPPVLVLDEPTTGLDPAQIIEVRRLIKDLGGERTILLSTHILPEVSQVCQKVIIVDKGQIKKEDTPENLANEIQKGLRTIISVDGPMEEIMGTIKSIEGVLSVRKSDGEGEFIVETKSNKKIRPFIARAVVESGWDLREMRSVELSLEEIFVHLVTEEGGQTRQ